VFIFGSVQKPGTYQQATQITKNYYADSKNPTVRTDLTISNVISNAGGVLADADLSNISVKVHGLPDKFIEHGSPGELHQLVKLDAEGIAEVAKEYLKITRGSSALHAP